MSKGYEYGDYMGSLEFLEDMIGGIYGSRGTKEPKKDCADKDGVLIIKVPGFSRDDVSVTVDGSIMSVDCQNEVYGNINKVYKLNPDIIGMDVSVRYGICKITFERKVPEMEIRFI